MRDLPIAARLLINIFLYIIYVVFVWIIFSFVFPFLLQVFGKSIISPEFNMELYDKIAMFIAILVLLLSIIWRKYFYLCGRESNDMIVLEEQVVKKKPKIKDLEDEDIKIFIDREVK